MTTVINLLGAPGAGKSTLAAGLFYLMKRKYKSVELVTEYAKDLHYDGHKSDDLDQLSVFAEQNRRITRLIGKVDYVISDSPLFLSAYYANKNKYSPTFANYVLEMAKAHQNCNYLVKRAHRYDPNGRSQDEAGSDQIHEELQWYMHLNNIEFQTVSAGDFMPPRIFTELFGHDEDSCT